MPTLDDPYDMLLGPHARPSSLQPPPLSQPEQDSLLSRVGSGALHGLGWIGSSLSKAFGGRAIRGALGGRPEELLSIIPFSDTLGITDPTNEVHGSDLLGGDANTDFFSPEGLAGFGVDILTDPATYLTAGAGALTKTGKLAKLAGVLPKTSAGRIAGLAAGSPELEKLAEITARGSTLGARSGPVAPNALASAAESLAGQRLGGHFGLHIPFTDASTTFDLSGLGRAAGAIPGASWVGDKVSQAAEPFRLGFNSLFRAGAKGQMDPILQELAMKISQEAPGVTSEQLSRITPLIEEVQRMAGWRQGMQKTPEMEAAFDAIGKQLRTAVERLPGEGQLTTAGMEALANIPPEVIDLAQRAKSILSDSEAARKALGYTREGVEGYFPRTSSQRALDSTAGRRGTESIKPEEWIGRNKQLFGNMFTEGPGSINELSLNRALHDMNPQEAQAAIMRQYLGWNDLLEGQYAGLKGKQLQALGPEGEQRLAELLSKVEAGTANNLEHGELAALNFKKSQSMTEPEIKTLNELNRIRAQAGELQGWQKKLDIDALDKVGGFFGNHPLADMEQYMIREGGAHQNAKAAYDAIKRMGISPDAAQTGARSAEEVLKELGLATPPDLAGLMLPKDKAEALLGFIRPANAPEGARPWLSLLDSVTNLTKAGQTAWPATMMRNVLSDLFMRFTGGGNPFAPLMSAKTLREGGIIDGIASKIPRFAGMTDAEATQALAREIYQLGLTDTKKYQALEAAGINPLLETTRRQMPTVGVPGAGLREMMGKHIPGVEDVNSVKGFMEGRLNPLNVRGVGARTESGFAPVGAAQSAQSYLEDLNRMATYIDAAQRGFHPTAAMEQVIRAHHDFGNLSSFEKNVMRRLAPFYSWNRANLPAVIGQLAEAPGGRMAQAMRLFNEAQGRNPGFFPSDLSQTGYAIPAGQPDENGRRNFLTSTGLNFEDLGQLTSLQQMAGSLNPLIRAPIELAMGRQFMNTRDLPTRYPLEGSPILNELLLASPISRVLSTGRMIGQGIANNDVLPAATSVLGPRLTSVDVAGSRRTALRQTAEDMLRGVPEVSNFNRLYVPAEMLPNLSAQEMEMYRLYRWVEQQRRVGGGTAAPSLPR